MRRHASKAVQTLQEMVKEKNDAADETNFSRARMGVKEAGPIEVPMLRARATRPISVRRLRAHDHSSPSHIHQLAQ